MDHSRVKKVLPKLTLIVGGAASGKSRLAETLAEKHGTAKVYLATAQSFDDEMAQKIAVHKSRRAAGWQTVEAPIHAAEALKSARGDVILFDCATLWLSNQMLDDTTDLEATQADLLQALYHSRVPVIVVSNEVGDGIVPENALARRFREAQGRLNIELAAAADLVIRVTVGLPHILKGQMP